MRYVVLHHEGFGEPHYDLMFESIPGSPLTSWRSPEWPPVAGDQLTRLGDHRRDYLEFEGPVSNNRGEVKRIVAGKCEHSEKEGLVTLHLFSPQDITLLLRQETGDAWRVVEVQ